MDNNTNTPVQKTPSPTMILVFGILSLAIGSIGGAIFGFVARSLAKKYLAATGGETCTQVKVGNILALIGIIVGLVAFAGSVLYIILYGFTFITALLAGLGSQSYYMIPLMF